MYRCIKNVEHVEFVTTQHVPAVINLDSKENILKTEILALDNFKNVKCKICNTPAKKIYDNSKVYDMLNALKGYTKSHEISSEFKLGYHGPSIDLDSHIKPNTEYGYPFQDVFYFTGISEGENEFSWVRLTTKNRLVYLEHKNNIGDIINEYGFSASGDKSYTWHPKYTHVYEIFITKGNKNTVKNQMICKSTDPRADECIFEYLREHNIKIYDASYGFIENGFIITCHPKETLNKIVKLFEDCKCSVNKSTLTVIFPDMQNE